MKTYCERCGKRLEAGDLRYLVTIHATADFDGTLPAQGGIKDLEAFMRQMDNTPKAKLEHDVFESRGFVFCPTCKEEYMAYPMGSPEGPADDPNEEGRVH